MSNLAIIPARGGSKRIPRKNIKDFLGKPIIYYSIDVAYRSGLFDEIMVSTDDDEIAEIAQKYDACIPFMRSDITSSDYATTIQVVEEVVRDYNDKLGKVFKHVCCIYPTAPLIEPEDIKRGLSILFKYNYNIVFPVVPFGYPVWRGLRRNEDEKTKMIWPENHNARSQDLLTVYHDAGQWYWFNTLSIKDDLLTRDFGTIVLDELSVQDIDNENDWLMAELKYKLKNETKDLY